MRIRKSPWDRCGSWRWLAWDTGFTWRPQSVGSLDVQKLSEGGDPRACRAESQKAHGPGSFHASVGIRPRTSHVNVGWQPLPLEGEGTSGLTSQRLLGQDNRGPSEVCKATHSPGRRNPQSLGWAGPTVGQGLPRRRGRLPARWGRGSAPGMPRRGGTGRGYLDPAPAQVANGRGGAG